MYIVPQNMRLMPKSRHANGFKPLRNKSGAIHPGMVQTEFSEVRFKEIQIELKSIPRFHTLQPEDIADIHFVYPADPIMLILPI
jgi:hypothetical protein